jgi:hypothetical protein
VIKHVLVNNEYVSETFDENEISVPITVLEGCNIDLSEVFRGI